VLQCVAVCSSVANLSKVREICRGCAAALSMLQCVAVCCGVLWCVVVCCSVLQCVAVCCSVLQCVAVCFGVLRCDVVAICRQKLSKRLNCCTLNLRRCVAM